VGKVQIQQDEAGSRCGADLSAAAATGWSVFYRLLDRSDEVSSINVYRVVY